MGKSQPSIPCRNWRRRREKNLCSFFRRPNRARSRQLFLPYLQRTASGRICPLYQALQLQPDEAATKALPFTENSAATHAKRTSNRDQHRPGIRYRQRGTTHIGKLAAVPLHRNWPAGIIKRDVNENAARHQDLPAMFPEAFHPNLHRDGH